MASNRQNPKRVTRPDPMRSIERGSSEEMEDEDSQSPSTSTGRRWRQQWLAEVDLETRRAYGSAIMSGHGMCSIHLHEKPCVSNPPLHRP